MGQARRISVNGHDLAWSLQWSPSPQCTLAIFARKRRGRSLRVRLPWNTGLGVGPKPMLPSFVAHMARTGLAEGWDPESKGAPHEIFLTEACCAAIEAETRSAEVYTEQLTQRASKLQRANASYGFSLVALARANTVEGSIQQHFRSVDTADIILHKSNRASIEATLIRWLELDGIGTWADRLWGIIGPWTRVPPDPREGVFEVHHQPNPRTDAFSPLPLVYNCFALDGVHGLFLLTLGVDD